MKGRKKEDEESSGSSGALFISLDESVDMKDEQARFLASLGGMEDGEEDFVRVQVPEVELEFLKPVKRTGSLPGRSVALDKK
jgi:hypothetical protein